MRREHERVRLQNFSRIHRRHAEATYMHKGDNSEAHQLNRQTARTPISSSPWLRPLPRICPWLRCS